MKTFFLAFAIIALFCVNSFSQLGNNNMTLLANINNRTTPYAAVWGYEDPKDGREYAIIGTFDGTSFVDITDPYNIHEVGFVPSTSPGNSNNSWREMKTYSHYAYIVSEVPNSGVQIIDLQYLPDSVRYVKKFLFTGYSDSHSISQEGPYLYLNGSNSGIGNGITVLDLTSNPETPVIRGSYNIDYVHDCRVKNDTIYAANIYISKVSIISAVNKNSLSLISSFINQPNSGPHNTAVTSDSKYILVTDEIGNSPRQLKIWNREDLGDITYVSGWQPTGITTAIVHNVEVYGNYALVAHYRAGVRLVDITNKSAPTEVAWFDTYPASNSGSYSGCWGVYMFPSGKIIASDMQTGLYVLKTPFNITMAVEGFYNSATNQMNISDTVRAYLRNSNSPYSIVDSSKALVSSANLTGKFDFFNAPAGSYYLVMKHRNTVDTWSSATPIDYNPMKMNSYNFTDASSKAYGNNMSQVDFSPVKYGVYSGDANRDNAIDLADLGLIDNDASNFTTGYFPTDVNGDNITDLDDVTLTDNNSFNFITAIVP
ncbi:MAG TPA: choice-of-anchor B family protein [Ignavibacteria bacterium]|nr:choice-of-anchor B family protein [Ignavibacteria bacterium]HRB00264.1 choice-of-anchor B family protein [Ignavibacteria bacterium]